MWHIYSSRTRTPGPVRHAWVMRGCGVLQKSPPFPCLQISQRIEASGWERFKIRARQMWGHTGGASGRPYGAYSIGVQWPGGADAPPKGHIHTKAKTPSTPPLPARGGILPARALPAGVHPFFFAWAPRGPPEELPGVGLTGVLIGWAWGAAAAAAGAAAVLLGVPFAGAPVWPRFTRYSPYVRALHPT